MEHNDQGYIMNKIPLLNKLKSTMNIGFHTLAIPNTKPYSEFTVGLDNLGFGKFKCLELIIFARIKMGLKAGVVLD
jgi:hypothetical protein